MNDAAIEQELRAKGKTAPRITPENIQANITAECYFTAAQGTLGAAVMEAQTYSPQIEAGSFVAAKAPLDLLTFCVLVLRNGFTVVGQSACASPENFDPELGKRIARKAAVDQIWPLMGYELRSKLASQARYGVGEGVAADGLSASDAPVVHVPSGVSRELPLYQCHKLVHALKIKEIRQAPTDQERAHPGGDWYLVPDDADYAPICVGHNDYYAKHRPQAGGYYVVYDDGYISYSPAQPFEAGYTRIG